MSIFYWQHSFFMGLIIAPTNWEKNLILLGVDLRIRSQPKLHSKVYQFKFTEGDTASFVGSANFTMGGFERNDESVAYFRSKEENKLVEAEINRLANYGTKSYTQWKAFNSRRKKGKQ